MMFLDCPAYLDDEGAARCALPAEVMCSYTMQSSHGPLDSVMIKCPSGHLFNGPLEFLTWENGEGQDASRRFDRGPGSDAMEPASTYTIMAEPEPDGSVAGWGKSGMRANDTDVVVDAGVAGASIAAVLARGGGEGLLFSWPGPFAQRGIH
jgi:hypothetical protein